MNHAACVTALHLELDRRRLQGETIPAGVAEIVLSDIENAAGCRDGGRLLWLQSEVRGLVGELLEHHAAGLSLPI